MNLIKKNYIVLLLLLSSLLVLILLILLLLLTTRNSCITDDRNPLITPKNRRKCNFIDGSSTGKKKPSVSRLLETITDGFSRSLVIIDALTNKTSIKGKGGIIDEFFHWKFVRSFPTEKSVGDALQRLKTVTDGFFIFF